MKNSGETRLILSTGNQVQGILGHMEHMIVWLTLEKPINTRVFYRYFFLMIFLSVLFVLTIGNVQARPTQQTETDFATVDAYVTEQVKNLDIPGLALGIIRDGQIAHLKGFGVANSSGRAVIPQTPFYIGSVSKSFTALAVMQLVEAGKIDLDLPVQTYLPWFELADKGASARITVRHLLNQTTGILDQRWKSLLGQPARFGRNGAPARYDPTHPIRWKYLSILQHKLHDCGFDRGEGQWSILRRLCKREHF